MPAETQAYERDPYLTELSTSVVSAGDDDGRAFVVLEDTVLYPEGGGQPGDHGAIDDVPVREVKKVEGAIRHYLESAIEETSVNVVLDWRRRYDHMQQHTAQHLLSALFLNRYGWPTTSFHLGESRCDIELAVPSIEPEVLAAITSEFMERVRAALPVNARRVSAEEYRSMDVRGRGLPAGHRGSVRLVEIESVDTTTCGGTHLRSTAEVESIHLGPTEAMRGGVRLFWIAGGRVRRRLGELEDRIAEMRTLFETSEGELTATSATRLATLKETSRELRHRIGELAEARATALALSPDRLVDAHFDGVDGGFLANVGRALVAQAGTKLALLTATADRGHFFLVAAGAESGVSLVEAGPKVAAAIGGRGGGSGTTFQGKADSLEHRKSALDALRRAASGTSLDSRSATR
jgi:Ser-tRNA(Ala) deacylase AlaX